MNFFSDLFEEGKGWELLRARVSQDLVEEGKGWEVTKYINLLLRIVW
jgi:hypothetical protein